MQKVPTSSSDKNRHKEPYRSNNSLCLGIFIGIMISVVISISVVYYYQQKQGTQQELKSHITNPNPLLHTQLQLQNQPQLNELVSLADVSTI